MVPHDKRITRVNDSAGKETLAIVLGLLLNRAEQDLPFNPPIVLKTHK